MAWFSGWLGVDWFGQWFGADATDPNLSASISGSGSVAGSLAATAEISAGLSGSGSLTAALTATAGISAGLSGSGDADGAMSAAGELSASLSGSGDAAGEIAGVESQQPEEPVSQPSIPWRYGGPSSPGSLSRYIGKNRRRFKEEMAILLQDELLAEAFAESEFKIRGQWAAKATSRD